MEHPVLMLGDTDAELVRDLTALDDGNRLADGDPVPERPRAVLAFADLRGESRHQGKDRLRALSAAALSETRRHRSVQHIIFAVVLPPRLMGGFDRLASGLGARLHSDLVRDNARDVEVTFLDVSGCGSIPTLTERLLARCGDPAGAHGVVVLDWDDIRERSIASAARNEYL
ncbi:hypothetical protein AB3M83_02750 [Microbacterium sp. 179-B 1A2 NHS]|uniref:hypothetical protein n=1 Tax=Microbacterium sp. 179-B 1A2 NHS TaxID=3142383 RepID=UPI0039A01A83